MHRDCTRNSSLCANYPFNIAVSLQGVKVQSDLLYNWWSTANHFVLATRPLRPSTRIFIFQLNTCGYSPYVTSSSVLWVCRLQLLLVSPAQSFSDPSPGGLLTTFYCLRFETPPTWRARSPVFISPKIMAPLYPRH
jgi:hypothetical protein